MKSDGLMYRNYLKGTQGDAINALLSGAGQNLRLILRHLRIFWRKIGQLLCRYTAIPQSLHRAPLDNRLFQGRLIKFIRVL